MSHHSTHRTLFQHYIRAGVQASLARVQAAEHIVPELDRQQAWHLLSFALDVPEVWDVTRALLLALAPKMEQAGFRQSWMVYLVEAHERSHDMSDWQADAEFELQIGLQHRLSSHFTEARQWTKSSVEHFAALGDSAGERRALNELAWLEQLQHRYGDATQHAERALALSTEDDVERGMSYRVLGMIANSQRKWQEAQGYHEQALSIFEQCNEPRRIAWSLQNLALSIQEQLEYEKAIILYEQAIELLNKQNDIYHKAIVQMNLGRTYDRLKKSDEGLLHLTQAATLFYQWSDILNIARVETNLGICHHSLKDYESSQKSFLNAMASYNKLGDQVWRLNATAGLGMAYVGAQEYDKAINIMEQALSEIERFKDHPYYKSVLSYLQQYLAEARQGQE